MARIKERNFGQVIRERRRQLDLTQQKVARAYQNLHAVRRPSGVGQTPSVRQDCYAPGGGARARSPRAVFSRRSSRAGAADAEVETAGDSAWEDFKRNEQLRRVHNITGGEMEMLSRVALLGDVRSTRDFIYILNTVRHAVSK